MEIDGLAMVVFEVKEEAFCFLLWESGEIQRREIGLRFRATRSGVIVHIHPVTLPEGVLVFKGVLNRSVA